MARGPSVCGPGPSTLKPARRSGSSGWKKASICFLCVTVISRLGVGTAPNLLAQGSNSFLLPFQMPVCSYFLKGICNNSNCPYSHVYVSRKAEVCPDFLKGYCPRGEKVKQGRRCFK